MFAIGRALDMVTKMVIDIVLDGMLNGMGPNKRLGDTINVFV